MRRRAVPFGTVGGRIAGKPKKDRTALLAARQAARQARQARKAALLP